MTSPDRYRPVIYAFRFALWAATEFKGEIDPSHFSGEWRSLVEFIRSKNFSAASACIRQTFGITLNEGEKLTDAVGRTLAMYEDYERIRRLAGSEQTRVDMAWKFGCWEQFKREQLQLATILKEANE